MIWEKTWFSYFMWICYTSIICLQSISVLVVAGVDMGFHNRYIIFGIIVLFFLAIAGAYFGTGMHKTKIQRKTKLKSYARNTIMLWALIPGLFIGVGFRVYTILTTNLNEVMQSPYIIESFVKGTPLEFNGGGVTFMYMSILRIIFSFFGNYAVAALWLQFILQLIIAFALCEGLRRLVNRAAGAVMFVAIMVFPEAIALCSYPTPMTLQLCLLSVGFAILGYFFDKRRRGMLTPLMAYFIPCFMGLYFAIAIYADFTGILLLLFGASVWRTVGGKSSKNRQSGYREVQVLLMFIFTIVGLGGIFVINSLIFNIPFSSLSIEWQLNFLTQVVSIQPISVMYLNAITSIVLQAFLFLGIFVFFKNKDTDCISGFYMLFFGIVIIVYTGRGSDFMITSIFYHITVMLVTSAIIGNLVKHFSTDVVETVALDSSTGMLNVINQEEMGSEIPKTTDSKSENIEIEEVKSENIEIEEVKSENIKVEEIKSENVKIEEIKKDKINSENGNDEDIKKEDDTIEEEQPKVKFLHNPLPVPKKHVPKTMDYDLDFEDLEDDYDIKEIEKFDYDI